MVLTPLIAAVLVQQRIPVTGGAILAQEIATLQYPWGMAYLPDGRLLITEKPGRVRIFANGALTMVSGVPAVVAGGQGGLLDIQVDPHFKQNHMVYVYYTERAEKQPADNTDPGDHRFLMRPSHGVLMGGAVARARLEGKALTGLQVIWRQVPKTIGRGHFGGRIVFAPNGTLFITSGERQRFDPAQDMRGNLGKIVRINPDGSVPRDNPFANARDARSDVWSLGHRNPLGAAINPATGKLWINEMGPRGGDEVNIPQPGKNYGWPVVSNGDNYDGSPIPRHPTHPEFVPPLRYWNPVISPSGMIFYTGRLFPRWRGDVFIGGLSSKALIRLKLQGNKVIEEEQIQMGHRIRDVEQAPDGAIMVLTDEAEGHLVRLTPAR